MHDCMWWMPDAALHFLHDQRQETNGQRNMFLGSSGSVLEANAGWELHRQSHCCVRLTTVNKASTRPINISNFLCNIVVPGITMKHISPILLAVIQNVLNRINQQPSAETMAAAAAIPPSVTVEAAAQIRGKITLSVSAHHQHTILQSFAIQRQKFAECCIYCYRN